MKKWYIHLKPNFMILVPGDFSGHSKSYVPLQQQRLQFRDWSLIDLKLETLDFDFLVAYAVVIIIYLVGGKFLLNAKP